MASLLSSSISKLSQISIIISMIIIISFNHHHSHDRVGANRGHGKEVANCENQQQLVVRRKFAILKIMAMMMRMMKMVMMTIVIIVVRQKVTLLFIGPKSDSCLALSLKYFLLLLRLNWCDPGLKDSHNLSLSYLLLSALTVMLMSEQMKTKALSNFVQISFAKVVNWTSLTC